jgi:hypothetical protein
MKLFILFSVLILNIFFTGCSSRVDGGAENSVQYYSKGYLIPFEARITITGNNLELFYSKPDMQSPFDENYSITEKEQSGLFDYLKEIDFLKMEVPEPEKKLDSPVTKLKADLNGSSREIDVGQMSSVPETLNNLKQKIFDLASEYKPGWKKEIGFE